MEAAVGFRCSSIGWRPLITTKSSSCFVGRGRLRGRSGGMNLTISIANTTTTTTTTTTSTTTTCGIAEPSGEPAPLGQKTRYKDGWLEKMFMGLFARKMDKYSSAAAAAASSSSSNRSNNIGGLLDYDYDKFVEVSKKVMQGRSRKQQQQVVREVLLSMLPPGAPAQFRKLFPPSRWAEEFNAALTVPFFHWLVGPSEVVEVEVNGEKQRSGVHIKKCRYLENSGCVGMCVNMCKIPTQDFFTNEFGLPLTMIPNFEDMSCEMVYGQTPPPLEEDPAMLQPCYTSMCSLAKPHSSVCPKLQ
ncbi:hypothetical protein Sjap_021207 [Stephania japonica]|uniref:Beta-carotene isomerase D27-like C-terminal domain-containing protein n=1 Tax=Stephania japonica TaxID=461633 RepID=A0AAP0F7C5_9MAGN